jgi:hypothetical protein
MEDVMADETKPSKTLEIRVAELEDKLAKLHVTEDEMKAYHKVTALMGGAPGASPCVAAGASPCVAAGTSPCVAAPFSAAQCVSHCIMTCIHSCIHPCIKLCGIPPVCIIRPACNECFECSGGCFAGGRGGGGGFGSFGA